MAQQGCCADCTYFSPDDYETYGYGGCHRYPPQFADRGTSSLPQVDRMKAKWPSVISDDWCGEFKSDQPSE